MGHKKFMETCAKYEIEVTQELAERAVYQYRTVFAKVPKFWYAMEEAAKQTVLSRTEHTCGKLLWEMDGNFLRVKLPSGRTLAYHHPKVTAEGKLTFLSVNSTTNKYEVEETWGGKLVENVTQAVARDIMVEAMFGLLKEQYRILFTVHDELVLEGPKGKRFAQEVINIVTRVPAWAPGCPINAECSKTERYEK